MKKITTVAVFLLIGSLYGSDSDDDTLGLTDVMDEIVQLPAGSVLTKGFAKLVKYEDESPLILQIPSASVDEKMLEFIPKPRPVLVRLTDVLAFKKITVSQVYDLIDRAFHTTQGFEALLPSQVQELKILVLVQVYKNKSSILEKLAQGGYLISED